MKSIFSLCFLLFGALSMTAQYCPSGGGGTTGGGGGSTGGGSITSTGGGSLNSGGSFNLAAMQSNLYLQNQRSGGSYAQVKSEYKKMKGSPYLNDEAIEGTLVLNNGQHMENVPMQFDLFANEVIATNDKGEEIVLDTKYYKEIQLTIDGQELVFKKAHPKFPDRFVQVLYEDGDMIFFKEKNITIRQGMNYGITETQSRILNKTNYYIKQGEGQLAKVKLKKNDIFSLFPETELYALKEYAKQKGIKLKDESDFVMMFAEAADRKP